MCIVHDYVDYEDFWSVVPRGIRRGSKVSEWNKKNMFGPNSLHVGRGYIYRLVLLSKPFQYFSGKKYV